MNKNEFLYYYYGKVHALLNALHSLGVIKHSEKKHHSDYADNLMKKEHDGKLNALSVSLQNKLTTFVIEKKK